MVSIEEALNSIQNQEITSKVEVKPLPEVLGFALSENIMAPFDMPAFDNSAMDGYALCGLHQEYKIVGEIAAGDTKEIPLRDGEAARIFTGAKVPKDAISVIMQEKTQVQGNALFLKEMPKEGQSIRKKGSELKKGQRVLQKGHVLNPSSLGLIGSLGLDTVKVFSKPRIHMITTGNELVKPGQPKQEGQIYESNSFAIEGALKQFGFQCAQQQQVKDDYEETKKSIQESMETCDVLILSGGISVGDYDFVKQALEENGVEELFYKVFQKPGKPLYFGRKGNQFVFALPGNPASSLTCFFIYVLPLLQKWSGHSNLGLPWYRFTMGHDYENRFDRPSFLKARMTSDGVQILDGQGSSMIQSMALGNALAFVELGEKFKKGDLIRCKLIS
ncbi:MAG: molybdopterin molybdenumtransferase MoeA [Flavobacteriia bacterium]|nr:MAG: molybdopterin molybdenumtransferase MoeA [Flavobacteriia bacterium]